MVFLWPLSLIDLFGRNHYSQLQKGWRFSRGSKKKRKSIRRRNESDDLPSTHHLNIEQTFIALEKSANRFASDCIRKVKYMQLADEGCI